MTEQAGGFEHRETGSDEPATGRNVVQVLENGPYVARGELRIDGQPAPPRVSLCRCGASRNKPLCDGSHRAAGFAAPGELPPRAGGETSGEHDALEIRSVRNGPLHVTGPLDLVCGSGRPITRSESVWLCRCGASSTKPFCDGTHHALGFEA